MRRPREALVCFGAVPNGLALSMSMSKAVHYKMPQDRLWGGGGRKTGLTFEHAIRRPSAQLLLAPSPSTTTPQLDQCEFHDPRKFSSLSFRSTSLSRNLCRVSALARVVGVRPARFRVAAPGRLSPSASWTLNSGMRRESLLEIVEM